MPVAVLQSQAGVSGKMEVFNIYADHINTPRVIARAQDSKIVWRWLELGPFGKKLPEENPSGLGVFVYNLRFPGQLYDIETDLHQNYFRDFDPMLGRYIQSDPIGLEGGINTYLYGLGNPLSYIYPFGLDNYSTVKCDGNGNFTVININKDPLSRDCTEIHEKSHMKDLIKRYGKNWCQGKAKGEYPFASINGDDYKDFLRDSECRAIEAAYSCAQKCATEDGGKYLTSNRIHRIINYCGQYDSWRKF